MAIIIPENLVQTQQPYPDCLICQEPGADVTHVAPGDHATHRKCMRTWCMNKVPPATTLAPCITCQTILDVRPLFRPNSLRDLIHIVRLFWSRIQLQVLAVGVPIWIGLVIGKIARFARDYAIKLPINKALPLLQNINIFSLIATILHAGFCAGFFGLRVGRRAGLEGGTSLLPFLVGSFLSLSIDNSVFRAIVPSLVTAIVALRQAINR